MDLQYRGFRQSKGAASLDHCQDAFSANPAAGRFAVADGATESDFTEIWARLLVERFAATTDADSVALDSAWITDVRRSWQDEVRQQLVAKYGESEPPWHVEAACQSGAFSTFLGLVITAVSDGYRWRATAIGDTCLFHTRDGELLHHFPIEHSNLFDNTPQLLASCAQGGSTEGLIIDKAGRSNDRLWIATDALAEWCLSEAEANRRPWLRLEWLLQPMGTDERFAKWIDGLRSEGRLHNDDVTLLIVTL